jgi:hypothetical protein
MKGDEPSFHDRIAAGEYRNPDDSLAEIYFDSLSRAKTAANLKERLDHKRMADRAEKSLARVGRIPLLVEGEPRAVTVSVYGVQR